VLFRSQLREGITKGRQKVGQGQAGSQCAAPCLEIITRDVSSVMQSWREKSAEAIVDQTCRNKTNTPLIPAVKSHDVHGTRPPNSVRTAQGGVRRTDTFVEGGATSHCSMTSRR